MDDKFLKQKGLDAHSIKHKVYGTKASTSLYEIYRDPKTGILYTKRMGGQEPGIDTGVKLDLN